MLSIAIAMGVVLLVAGLVVAYVAFPHRGEEVPGVPWLTEAMTKAGEALPVIDEHEGDELFASRPPEQADEGGTERPPGGTHRG